MEEKLTGRIAVRTKGSTKDDFEAKSRRMGRDPSDLLREFVVAFNEGRLTITPTEEQKETSKELYS